MPGSRLSPRTTVAQTGANRGRRAAGQLDHDFTCGIQHRTGGLLILISRSFSGYLAMLSDLSVCGHTVCGTSDCAMRERRKPERPQRPLWSLSCAMVQFQFNEG
jgi:hypothetical protein